jgi:hypothetical protein
MLIRLLLILAVLGLAGMFIFGSEDAAYRAGVVSLAALCVSLVAAFKDQIFPFRPKYIVDEILLAAADSPRQDSPAIVLPLLVVNEGVGTGLISGLALKVEGAGRTRLYTPIAEIDFPKFISGRRRLHAENTIATFSPILVESVGHVRKHILFSQEPHSAKYPFSGWVAGNYTFKLYAASSATKEPREVASVGHTITADLLAQYANGQSSSLSSSREIDV